jgi:hypothetical protein
VPLTFEEMDQLVEQLAKERAVKEEHEKIAAEAEKRYRSLQGKVLQALQELDRKDYKCKFGAITTATTYSFALPRGDAKEEFIKFYGEKDFIETAHINSQTFNAWCKERYREAEAREDYEFKIPGVGEPKTSTIVKFSKPKG